MANYKKRIAKPDTYEQIVERRRSREIREQALLETMFKFSPLTPDNFEEANTFRTKRIAELEK